MPSEAEIVEEEVNILDILSKESEEVEVEETEEAGEIPDTVEGLKDLLLRERELKSKRNLTIKHRDEAIDRIQQENDALRQKLDEIDRRLNTGQSEVETEKHEREVQEWQDRVADDPTQALVYAEQLNAQLADKIAGYLGEKFASLEQTVGGLKSATNPDMMKYRDQINALKKKEAFSGLGDEQLISIAKELGRTKVPAGRGPIAGKRPKEKASDEGYKLSDEERARMGF